MPKAPINLQLRSKIFVALIAGVLFFLGIVQVAQGFIETRDYRTQLIQAVKAQTGKDIVIRGNTSVSLLPAPSLYVPGVELRDPLSKTPTPAVTIEMLRVYASPLSIFSGTPQISHISLVRPTLEIERAQDDVIHWDWLNTHLLKLLGAGNSASIGIELSDGKILYRNSRADKEIILEHINARGDASAHPSMNGTFHFADNDLHFAFNTEGANGASGTTPLDLKFYTNDKNIVELKGSADLNADIPKISGAISLATEDLSMFLLPEVQAKVDSKNTAFDQITNQSAVVGEKTLLPFTFAGKWEQDGWKIDITDIQLDGLDSKASGSIALIWADKFIFDADMNFAGLSYNKWKLLLLPLFMQQGNDKFVVADEEQTNNILPADLEVSLKLKADKINVDTQEWHDGQLAMDLENGSVTVNQFSIRLPGDSSLSLFGILTQTNATGLRFEGTMETEGKSLRNTLTVFDPSAADLPETGFGDFYMRSNIFVSPEQVRLSEADAKISELHLNGGLVAYFDNNPRVEADVKLKDINFDYFRDVWRAKQKEAGQQLAYITFDKNVKFGWLNKLNTTIDFKVNVDQFTFLERKGDNVSFRLFAKKGQFSISNMHFYYPGDTIEASFNITMNDDQPFFDVLLNSNEFNTDYLSLEPIKKTAARHVVPFQLVSQNDISTSITTIMPQAETLPAQDIPAPAKAGQTLEDMQRANAPAKPDMVSTRPLWSEDLIDMSWMDGISGWFDISIGNLIHKDTSVRDFKLKAQLGNNALAVQSLSFSYWQGRCEATGTLYGGRVPGFSLGFTMTDAELQDILKSWAGRENITGRTSVSGTVTTSGVNYLSWIQQAEAKLVLSARGVSVQGLNLQGAVDAVSVARTAADVFNNVNLAIGNGSTDMSVDGNVNVRNGVIRTPGITLKAGTITGNLSGEVKMVPWTINLSTLFYFPAMTSETVPSMTIQLAGPMDAPVMQTDTSSLESYVAKRIVGR